MQKQIRQILLLRIMLLAMTLLLFVFTYFAFRNEGPNLFSVMLKNIQEQKWNAQFNLDFSCYLLFSGLWIMWREKFSWASLLLGIAASVLGIVFFAPYLFFLSFKEPGIKRMLLGKQID